MSDLQDLRVLQLRRTAIQREVAQLLAAGVARQGGPRMVPRRRKPSSRTKPQEKHENQSAFGRYGDLLGELEGVDRKICALVAELSQVKPGQRRHNRRMRV